MYNIQCRYLTEIVFVGARRNLILYYTTELLYLRSSFVLHTRAEGDGVEKRAGDLLCRSLVPQREMISIKHTFLVLRCQEISEETHRVKLKRGAKDQIHQAQSRLCLAL